MKVCSNEGIGSGCRDPWRSVSAGRGVGKRFAWPADHPDPRVGQERVPARPG